MILIDCNYPIGYKWVMQTIREFGDFYKDAVKLLGQDGYEALVDFIAARPEEGDVIPGTGGFRKLRFRRPGRARAAACG
jgi:hypothetical protein